MISGIDELEKVINDYVEQFDAEAHVSTDFYCDLSDNTIGFALVSSKESVDEFMDSVNRLNPEVELDPFLWSLLHEVGHIMTEDDFTEEDFDNQYEFVSSLKRNGNKLAYYDSAIERAATEWAVDYANNNFNELAFFWELALPALLNVYKLNGVE